MMFSFSLCIYTCLKTRRENTLFRLKNYNENEILFEPWIDRSVITMMRAPLNILI